MSSSLHTAIEERPKLIDEGPQTDLTSIETKEMERAAKIEMAAFVESSIPSAIISPDHFVGTK